MVGHSIRDLALGTFRDRVRWHRKGVFDGAVNMAAVLSTDDEFGVNAVLGSWTLVACVVWAVLG